MLGRYKLLSVSPPFDKRSPVKEVNRVWTGMEVALPYEYWSNKFDNMTPRRYAAYLKSLAANVDVYKFQKNRRGPKKKVKKKFAPKVNHVSTFQILNDRKCESI
jgi:hypothetical protein